MTKTAFCIVALKPGIEVRNNGLKLPIPLLGPAHADPELNSDFLHRHIDWSRVPEYQYQKACELAGDPRILCRIVFQMESVSRIEQRYMPRLRTPPECLTPGLDHAPDGRLQFEQAYADFEQSFLGSRLDCNRCPHQNISLSGVPTDSEGLRTCPFHGLRFSRDGRMVPRIGSPFPDAFQALARVSAAFAKLP